MALLCYRVLRLSTGPCLLIRSLPFFSDLGRAFYGACGECDVPLGICIGPCVAPALREDGKLNDWNIFEFREGHHLQSDHHGYFVHCIIEHGISLGS
jgi:hypothetical protein